MQTFKRQLLDNNDQTAVSGLLQDSLVNLVDLALDLKQANWNVVGPNFRSVHLQLDEIIETVREVTDDIAERIVTLGIAPDGRAATIANQSRLDKFQSGFQDVEATVTAIADEIMQAVEQLRMSIDKLSEVDSVSQDLLIGVSARLEKHLWMIQAQEVR